MFFKKRDEQDNEIPSPISKIIGGKLYDASRATHICDLRLWYMKIPDFNPGMCYVDGEYVSLYKGNVEYFLVVRGDIKPVTEEWVKDILGQYNTEKYIELFGEPELA